MRAREDRRTTNAHAGEKDAGDIFIRRAPYISIPMYRISTIIRRSVRAIFACIVINFRFVLRIDRAIRFIIKHRANTRARAKVAYDIEIWMK